MYMLIDVCMGVYSSLSLHPSSTTWISVSQTAVYLFTCCSVLSHLISQPTSSYSFPPPPPPPPPSSPQAAEKLSLMKTLWGGERRSGSVGSCGSFTERHPFKHTHTLTHTHLLTNSNNGLHGCQFSELHTLTLLPLRSLLADIKEPLFTHTGTQLTGTTEAGLPRVSSIHHCLLMEN